MPEKIIVYTVGSSPQPLICSINENRPDRVLLFPSADTNDKIHEIEKGLVWDGCRDKHKAVLKAPQNLLACVRQIRREVVKFLEDRNLPLDTPLLADFTGGTKVMSAALALAMTEFQCNFCYVGGSVRSDDASHRTVVPGHEEIMIGENPWDALAVMPLMKLVDSFNNGQFGMAKDIIDDIVQKKIRPTKFYMGLQNIIDGFAAWDAFDHVKAQKSFRSGMGLLLPYAEINEKHQKLYSSIQKSQAIHDKVANDAGMLQSAPKGALPDDAGRAYLLDLLANAGRRGRLGRYDDAVARLYSAIEKIAKIELLRHGKDNGNLTPEDFANVSEQLRTSVLRNNNEGGKIKLALKKSFLFLKELDENNPVVQTYLLYEQDLRNTLRARNQSLLAHGFEPVGKEAYDSLFNIVLRIIDVKEENLPRFPTLAFDDLIN